MKWGSSAVGQADVSQGIGTVMGHQTVWMTLMSTTVVSYLLFHLISEGWNIYDALCIIVSQQPELQQR